MYRVPHRPLALFWNTRQYHAISCIPRVLDSVAASIACPSFRPPSDAADGLLPKHWQKWGSKSVLTGRYELRELHTSYVPDEGRPIRPRPQAQAALRAVRELQ